jgi:catechol 2,3-dioxygenase-like lactoylglutathione lyase family enzyme
MVMLHRHELARAVVAPALGAQIATPTDQAPAAKADNFASSSI